MIRASFTITTTDGRNYDANHLAVTTKALGEEGAISMLSFVCSGVQECIPATDVAGLAFHPVGAQHCSECDGPLYALVGAGVHANERADGPATKVTVP